MANRLTDQNPQWFNNGSPASNGEIEFFNAGTTGDSNRKNTYSDEGLSIVNPNPVPFDSNGRPSFDIYMAGSYQYVVRDKKGVQIDTVDNAVGIGTATTTGTLPPIRESFTATAGQVLFSFATSYTLGVSAVSAYRKGSFVVNFSETSSSSVTFDAPALEGDLYVFEIRQVNDDPSTTAALNVVYTPPGTGAVTTNVQAKLEEYSSVKDFEATGDGITDDTEALKAAFAGMGSDGWKLELEGGKTYLFDPSEQFGINLNGVTNFVIEGNGATIKCIDGTTSALNGVIMWFENCEDGLIQNLNFDGNLPNRTGTVSAGSHNVKLRNLNKRLKFVNCRFDNATNDGFYMDTTSAPTQCQDIEIINCHGTNCYRGCISAISSTRLRVSGGSYYGTVGANPKHGLDFEDDGVGTNNNYIVEGVRFYNNGTGIQATGINGSNGKIRNCSFVNNSTVDLVLGNCDNMVIENLVFGENNSEVTRSLFDVGGNAGPNITIRNITFTDANPTGGSKYTMYVIGNGQVEVDGVTINGTNSRGLSFQANDGRLNNLTVNNTTGSSSDYALEILGDRVFATNIKTFNTTAGCIVGANASEVVIDGFYSTDCLAANFVLWWNRADAVLKNANVIQSTSIPAGQEAFKFTAAPRVLSGIYGLSAGTDYDGSNILDFLGGVASDTILENITPGFWSGDRMSNARGDGNHTIERGIDETTQYYGNALTANRTLTISTTNAKNGDKFKIVRDGGGAFTLDVGGLKTLNNNEWCEVQWVGAWVLSQFGSL